MQTAVS